ncbi:MAG: hypothetical protein H7329_01710 [Opitutaceae bacterium]|nr:hypothetical protein [Cytophagales bacterium]
MGKIAKLIFTFLFLITISGHATPSVERWRNGIKKIFPTIQSAIDSSLAGDKITLRGGTYFENISINGHPGNINFPIELEGFPGETIIIDGADRGLQVIGNTRWKSNGGGEYQAIVPFSGNQAWNRISPASISAGDSLMATYWLEPKFDSLQRGQGIIRFGDIVKIRLKGNNNPANKIINIGTADAVLKIQNTAYWKISNITLKNAGFAGIYLAGYNVNNISIDKIKVFTSFRGITTEESANAQNISITNCKFSNSMPSDWAWLGYQDCSSNSEDWKSPQRSTGIMIKGTTNTDIKNCEIDGWWDGMKLTGSYNKARYNVFHNINDDMVELESKYSTDIKFHNNVGYDLNVGISLVNNVGGNIYIFRNRISCTRPWYKENSTAKYYGYSIKFSPGWGVDRIAKNVKIFNNTFYAYRANIWDANQVEFQYFEFINNIFYSVSTYYNSNFVDHDTSAHTFANGCYWSNNMWNKQPNISENGIRYGDPGFVSVQYLNPKVNVNLNLLPGSLAKDAGTTYANTRWPGIDPTIIIGKPDIGANEIGINDNDVYKASPDFSQSLSSSRQVVVTGIEDVTIEPEVEIYPNPAKEVLYIKHPQGLIINEIGIRNMKGQGYKFIPERVDQTTLKIELNGLDPGFYIVNFASFSKLFNLQ